MFTHYDRAHIAQLCENAGLLQRVRVIYLQTSQGIVLRFVINLHEMYAVVRIGITITMMFSRRNEKEKTLCDFR